MRAQRRNGVELDAGLQPGQMKRFLITFSVVALVLFARLPHALVHPALFAEDGNIFFKQQYEWGVFKAFPDYLENANGNGLVDSGETPALWIWASRSSSPSQTTIRSFPNSQLVNQRAPYEKTYIHSNYLSLG
jgi:hypothetical protein